MGRSIKKGPFIDPNLAKKVAAQRESGGSGNITTWARASMISPDFIGVTFMVHDGRRHITVYVVEDMVGHKLGEFAATRTYRGHQADKKARR